MCSRTSTPASYTVRAEKEGFKSEVRSGLILQLNQKARVDMKLSIGAVSETVEVSARGVILNTDDATIGNVVEQKRITDLPLNGRNFANLAGLMPGVIKGISSNTNQYGRRDTAIAISANGMRENQGQVLYDGVSTAWNINNATFFKASIEAIQEFKVHAGTYSAEYGHNAGAQVEILTRPGTNQLHGALFEFLRNDNFDARNYFRPRPLSKDILQRNQFGFVLSGPVWIPKIYNGRDKTFWMVNYEGQREKQEVASIASVAPDAFRTGDFSAISTPLRDPLGGTFPGNRIPANRLSPISQRYLEIYPRPNLPGLASNLAGVEQQINNINQVFARGDHNIGNKDKLFGRVAMLQIRFSDDSDQLLLTRQQPHHGEQRGDQRDSHLQPDGDQRGEDRLQPELDPSQQSAHEHGLQSRIRRPHRHPRGPSPQRSPAEFARNRLRADDRYRLSHDRRRRPAAGFQCQRDLADRRQRDLDEAAFTRSKPASTSAVCAWIAPEPTCRAAQFTFNGEITGNPVADFMIGYAGQSQSPEGILPVQFRQRTYAWYVQDEWKASRKLTLSLGLRYDYVGTVDEKNGIQRALRLDRPGGYLFPETPAPVTGREPIPLYTAEKNRFWPRVGIAYRPADGWVVRMGGGVYNNANQMNNLTVFSDPERRASNNYFWNPQNYITFANPFPASGVAAIPPINVVYISPIASTLTTCSGAHRCSASFRNPRCSNLPTSAARRRIWTTAAT